MSDEGDSWDAIDWDSKISEDRQPEKELKIGKFNFNEEEESDGNYFESNQIKKSQGNAGGKSQEKHIGKSSVKYVTPYAYKDLKEISLESDFHKIILKVYGDFEKYLMTHEEILSDESIVELIKINMALLQIPFTYHNRLLINCILKIESFWQQVATLIKNYYEKNSKDPRYVLLIDMKGFFEKIEALICWLVMHISQIDSKSTEIVELLMSVMNEDSDDEIFSEFKILKIQPEIEDCSYFEIYPKLSDLQSCSDKLTKNKIKGKYSDVYSYLKVQLPLLKEDFMHLLRCGFQHLKSEQSVNRWKRTAEATIIPNVKIEIIWQKVWNINCPLMIAHLNFENEIFNGQLVCFTSSKKCSDLIVATVLRNSQLELLIPKKSIIIEIISTENIEDIFNRNFFMVEPKSFFDPYAQVFQSLKCLHEHNFPFKKRILNLHIEPEAPTYYHEDIYTYKNDSFKLESDWNDLDFGLEKKQMEALKASIQNDFSLIVGPSGTGKSFIGIEIVRILLENTDEKILVLTQTNNALDKFLTGCLGFTDKVTRFGAQCKAKELTNFVTKRTTPHESKIYLRKLQAMQRDIVAGLIEKKAKPEDIFKEISFHYRLVEEVNQLDTYHSVREKKIFGMTTSFAAHNSTLMKLLQPSIVIIEEASEILESHVVASITKETKQIIMIGDHHQLRPQTNFFELQRKFNFNISLYERLIMNKFPHITLDVQMRMRTEFCDLIRNTIYDNLKDGENVKKYPDVTGMSRNFFFLTHKHFEESKDTSKENIFEVNFILNLYQKLLSVGNNADKITILTPYAAQARLFKDKLKELKQPHVRVAVLDAYQGEESDIILLSLVRSNKNNDIGFLAMENRICVILSRAKIGFYICGNMECFSNASSVWEEVSRILDEHDAIGKDIPDDLVKSRVRLSSKN